MNIAIIEDSPAIQKTLQTFIEQHFAFLHVSFVADSVVQAKKKLETHLIDIAIMDIELKDDLSFTLLRQLDNIDFQIIFISAHDHHSLGAIKFSAIDYLLKPLDQNELADSIRRALERTKHQQSIETMQLQVASLQSMLANNTSLKSKLMLPSSNEIIFLRLEEIVRLEASANYCHFYTLQGKRHVVSKPLKEYAEMLQSFQQFVKTHKSHIVNIEFVIRFMKNDGGYLVMEDGANIPVSRRARAEVFDRFF